MTKIGVFSYHTAESKRRAGMHWLAFAMRDLGHEVKFFTTSLSPISTLKKDYRICDKRYPINEWYAFEGIACFKWYALFHPVNLRNELLNRLSGVLFRQYSRMLPTSIIKDLADLDVIIIESCAWLTALQGVLGQGDFRGRLVYRVSDDLELNQVHPVVIKSERKLLPIFDYISVPSSGLREKLMIKTSRAIAVDHHGIQTELFDSNCKTSLRPNRKHAVFVGVTYFDNEFLDVASELRSDVDFHIIGPISQTCVRDNVIWYGELPFENTIPILKAADFALSPLKVDGDISVFSDSLKILQYTYLGLPIVVPEAFGMGRENFVHYLPGDRFSIARAIETALEMGQNYKGIRSTVYDWKVLADKFTRVKKNDKRDCSYCNGV